MVTAKTVAPHLLSFKDFLDRFGREALLQVSSPSIVEWGGVQYVRMDRLPAPPPRKRKVGDN